MSKTKSQLRYGIMWPEARESAHHHVGLTVAARRLAEATLEELGRAGVVVTLDDETGKAHFRATYTPSRAARLAIERQGDLVEALLVERERAARPSQP